MKYGMLVVILVAGATIAWGEEGVSVSRGKGLFESPTLGTNGRSCVTCHAGGKKLGETGAYNDAELSAIVNACIRKPLKGTPLPENSDDMKSLILYLRSLSGT